MGDSPARLALWSGLCLTIVVYSVNMFGDALRDLLAPRLRGGAAWAPMERVRSGEPSRPRDPDPAGRRRQTPTDAHGPVPR